MSDASADAAGLTRADAVMAGHTGDRSTATRCLTSPNPNVRASGLNALARLNALDADTLALAMADPSVIVRRRVATIGGQHPQLPVDLVALLDDADPSVTEVAAWAAGERAPDTDVIAALITVAADHPDALCRESAVAALGALEATEAVPTIIAACEDKPAVRRRAVLALAPFDGPDVEAALQRALDDRDWQTRQAAEDLL